ncbi:MAG: alanine:cation symporter family protein [Verrucomicrobiae bacterium]|jgi:AGCS family alanine or glycine:cation symporter|nr:alanine:cation symporter family protein [Verrucomicrobiae bacterium]
MQDPKAQSVFDMINHWLEVGVGYVWNIPLIVLLVGSGVLLSLLVLGGHGLVQWKGFRHAIDVVRGKFDHAGDPGEISHFQALCTALSATVGLGNIGGVAVAIAVGGPGATFWMVLVGIFGMALKYAECTLAVKYRRVDEHGVVHGGPMHYIERGLGPAWKPLAVFYAFGIMVSSWGAGNMFQTNQVASILESNFDIHPGITGGVLAFLTGLVIIGGIKRIATVTSKLVPFMGILYAVGALAVIITNIGQVPALLQMIFVGAFKGSAAVGGFAGVVFREVLVQGVRRACFSNEAGMGSAAIAHSAAATNEPVREGIVALLEPFIDTVVICTMTAMVILVSGAWTSGLTGVELTAAAFDSAFKGFGRFFVPVAVTLFAYSTLLSWAYYGERGADYLFGEKGVLPFKLVFCGFAVLGAVQPLGPVINFSDLVFGLLAIPNMIAVWALFPVLRRESISYFDRLAKGEFPRKD